jgi:hypothetical protein
MVDFYDITHLLTAALSDDEFRLAKQLTMFMSRIVASPHRPALLRKYPTVPGPYSKPSSPDGSIPRGTGPTRK